jgi:hypothetical protein
MDQSRLVGCALCTALLLLLGGSCAVSIYHTRSFFIRKDQIREPLRAASLFAPVDGDDRVVLLAYHMPHVIDAA